MSEPTDERGRLRYEIRVELGSDRPTGERLRDDELEGILVRFREGANAE